MKLSEGKGVNEVDLSKLRPTEFRSRVDRPDNGRFALKEGQMVHGQIKALHPGHLAEVQVGSERVVAKLEVPLKAGDAYYFQVRAGEPAFHLKIIAGPTGKAEDQGNQLVKLSEAMRLPKTPEMSALLSFILKQGIPMNREGLLQAEAFMSKVPTDMRPEALSAIRRATELELPFTDNILRSLLGTQSKEGLHSVLGTLKEALAGDPSVSPATREAVIASLDRLERPVMDASGNALLGKLVMTLLDQSERPDMRFTIVQLLKREGVLPPTASLANISQVLTAMAEKNLPENFQAVLRQEAGRPATEPVLQMIRSLAEEAMVKPFQSSEMGKGQLSSLFGVKDGGGVMDRLIFTVRAADRSAQAPLQTLWQSVETAVANAVEGDAMKTAMQTVIRSLGFNYESVLGERNADIPKLMESLKPQLVALMQDESVSRAVRDRAEIVISRLNGAVLLSGENGIQHQLITQIPLDFFGDRIDATLQWNGKMKEDGKIDPEFARILFYLELHSLAHTVIDMQVQNRIVSVTVYNADTALQSLGAPLQEKLKEGLNGAGYQLSGVFFKAFAKEGGAARPIGKPPTLSSEGVDFRI